MKKKKEKKTVLVNYCWLMKVGKAGWEKAKRV